MRDVVLWWIGAAEADPEGRAWVLAALNGESQPLGGFLGGALLGDLAGSPERRLLQLARTVPQRLLPWRTEPFLDLDDRASAEAWRRRRQG